VQRFSKDLMSGIQIHLNSQANLKKKSMPWGNLHLGCGTHMLDGFLNIDIADITAFKSVNYGSLGLYDLRRGLDLQNDSINFICNSHFLEHLSIKDGYHFLSECYRVLRPGGILRIVVPNIPLSCKAYVEGSIFSLFDSHPKNEEIYKVMPRAGKKIRGTDCLNFAVYDTGGEFGHKAIYDFETLRGLLIEIGFTKILPSEFDSSTDLADHKEFSIYLNACK
jgi:predicted SAM-dependent methyltransferase